MWIDSHCHLNHPNIKEKGTPSQLIKNAKGEGVSGMLTISCRISEEYQTLVDIAEAHENVWCTVGTHPHDAGKEEEKAISLTELIRYVQSHPKIIGIGESGLDYHYNYAPVDDQKESFRKHIRACIETNLPLIVHAREADKDIMQIIREEGAGTSLKGVMHCFSSGSQMAEEALDFGFYLSFSGILTFKKATALHDIAKNTPLDRLLVETDAPFLAPEPYRGKVNEPALVKHTGAFLAGLKDKSVEEMAKITSQNFFTLFDKAGKAEKVPNQATAS